MQLFIRLFLRITVPINFILDSTTLEDTENAATPSEQEANIPTTFCTVRGRKRHLSEDIHSFLHNVYGEVSRHQNEFKSLECCRCSQDKHIPKLYSAQNNIPGNIPPQLQVKFNVTCIARFAILRYSSAPLVSNNNSASERSERS